MRSPRLLVNGIFDGVEVSFCSSDCRVHSRARHLESCLTSRGQPQTPTPLPRVSTPSNLNTIRKLELQSFVTRRSLPSRFRSEYWLRISLRFFRQRLLLICERIDLAITSTPNTAPRRRRSREISKSPHSRRALPFQVDAKQLDIELALRVNPICQKYPFS